RDKKHVFFELCEKDPVSQDIVARIGLVIFAGKKTYIDEILQSAENAFSLKDDIEVKFLCKVDFYPPHGAIRLVVDGIDPVYTLGKIAQEKQKLIALLKKSGTLDKNKQLELPLVPLRIGLITSYDSAAYNDFCSELRLSGYGFQVFVKNTLMQGKGAEKDVCRAIDLFDQMKNIDVIVITRGGGSIAELSCFDSKAMAERIAVARLPVLSGIGHEINITVTDMAAHTYQKTPTAIAQFLVQRVEGFLVQAEQRASHIMEFAQEKIREEKGRIKDFAQGLQRHTLFFFKDHHQNLDRMKAVLHRQPLRLLQEAKVRIKDQKQSLKRVSLMKVKNDGIKLKGYERVVEMASPQKTFKRGFSITRNQDGKIVRNVNDLHPADRVVTQVLEGSFESEVKNIRRD
ncbi:MAG: exodeoxyribonuclease VII large subunit, partial [Candidatus Omnitrophica bacterium]|nr:exodeoxyribonuclease VII large subunit [Candidatus Omnitrophota bacterium]